MTSMLHILFWSCAAGVAYAYVAYPLLLLAAARLRRREVRRAPFTGRASFVLAAYNEAGRIAGRRDELVGLLDAAKVDGEVIIVSDGSADGTAAAARAGASDRVRVIELTENVGKAEALTRGVAAATGDVIVFADARQTWAPDALPLLLENFADPTVGGATGDLVLLNNSGATDGVGLYWRYEKAVRHLEGQIHSVVGATGAISAVRRELFRPIPRGTILDDVYWPMRVVMQGYRIVHDTRANAFDRLPDKPKDELRRKVRTLAGNFQLVARLPQLLLPWRNPAWLQFLSHKLLRLAVPWMLVALFAASLALPGAVYRIAAVAQAAGYLLAIVGLQHVVPVRSRLTSAAGSFVLLNAAAWLAFWVWLFGRAGTSWKKVKYVQAPAGLLSPLPCTQGRGSG